MSKTTIEFKKIFGLPFSMCISLALIDPFIGPSVTRIFGVISSVRPGFESRGYFLEKRNLREVDFLESHRMYSRFEKILKAKNILLILLFLGIGIWTMPWPISMPSSGLDPSWVIGINKAVSDNLQFGPDIAFTFGPLGFLYTQSYIDHTQWFLSFRFSLLWIYFHGILL